MGQTLDLSCECGYQKEVLVGEGLMAINLDLIRQTFTDGERAGFEVAIDNGIRNYSFGQRLAFCTSCNDIVSATALRYESGGQTCFVIKPCQQCNTLLEPHDEPGNCPKCGRTLKIDESGFWD